jgi:hypothetical protein
MANDCDVRIEREVTKPYDSGWTLCFQDCIWVYSDPNLEDEYGYRFIWRRPDGSLQAARGQARLPAIQDLVELLGLFFEKYSSEMDFFRKDMVDYKLFNLMQIAKEIKES